MSSAGGDSPRPFDATNSQADMSWLEPQDDQPAVLADDIVVDPAVLSFKPQTMDLDLSTSGQEHTGQHIKQEVSAAGFGPNNQVHIDLTESNDIPPSLKQEHPTQTFGWKEIPRYIEISDSEDERDPITRFPETDNMGANINHDDESIHRENGNPNMEVPEPRQAINDHDNGNSLPSMTNIEPGRHVLQTPNSKAKRPALNVARMKELQAHFRAKALSRDKELVASLSTGNSSSLGGASTDPVRIGDDDVEEDAASAANKALDEDQSNTLFIPQGSAGEKRARAASVNNQEIQEIDGSTFLDIRGKPKRKRRVKLKPMSAEEAEKLKEREWNDSFAIGLEHFNAGNGKRTGHGDIHKPVTQGRGKGRKGKQKASTGLNGAKPQLKRPSKKTKKKNDNTGDLRDVIAGLQSHDVLAEANANLDRAALATSKERDKHKHLSAILHSIPEDNRPGARGEKARLYRAATNFGHGVVTAVEGGWTFKGMKSTILHHQLLGASWMRERELGLNQPFGGLLADEMGFGKTVMMIITMVTNPPPPTDKVKSTLIVCSPSLMLQWKRELENHANKDIFRTVIIYHGSSIIQGVGLEQVLETADVVMTTYGQVVKSFPLGEPPEHLTDVEERRAWWEKHWNDDKGLLHKTHFHRVVLDESQAIKNHKAHTSRACQALMARYRWAISGTPVLNRIEEFYPYFKFLRASFAGSYDDFRYNFCGKGDRIYTDRLHACLNQFMLRRTHVDLIFGSPIIKLPECHTETTTLRPTKVERLIYGAVETRYAQAINAIAQWASEEHMKRLTMTMLTRLRQMTAHLFLVQHILQDMFEVDDVERLSALVATRCPSEDMVTAIKALVANKGEDEEPDAEPSVDDDAIEYAPPSDVLLKKFQDHLRSLVQNADASEFAKRTTCSSCGSPPEDPYVSSCMHVYCHGCLLQMAHAAAAKDEGATCLECHVVFNGSESCAGVKELQYDMTTGYDGKGDTAKKKRHKPPKDLLRWIRKDGGVLPSTKSAAIVDQIDKWLTEEPEKKIIVFCQWRMM